IFGHDPLVASCPFIWSTERDTLMKGFSVAQNNDTGAARWTIAARAEAILPTRCSGPTRIRVVASALSTRNLDDLRIEVNSRRVKVVRIRAPGGELYEGDVPDGVLRDGLAIVALKVKQLDTVPGEQRGFGIAVRRIEISPRSAPTAR